MAAGSQSASKLNYRIKIVYGVGEVANAIKMVVFGLYSMFFATAVMGFSGTWMGVIGFVALLWDALIDPYIGYLSDDARARARPYRFMLIGALTMGVSFWAFFSPPQYLSGAALFGWLLAASLLVRTATSLYTIPYYALGARLTRDYHERSSITGVRGVMSTVGTLLAASLSFVLFFPESTPGVDPKLDRAGYAQMGLSFGAAMTVVALITVLGTLPLRRRLDDDGAGAVQIGHGARGSPGGFFASMWGALQNASFRVLLAVFSLFFIGLSVNGLLLIHFMTYYMQISDSLSLAGTQGAFFLGGLAGIGFWLRMAKRVDKRWLCAFSAIATSLLMLSALALFGEGRSFGTGDVRPLLAVYALTGFCNCILWFIPPSMLADVADENELLSGVRGEGACFGIVSFAKQVATGIAVLVTGVLLDWYARLVPGQGPQSDLTVYRIAVVYSVVPAALFVSAAVLMLNYRLSRPRVLSIQAQLRRRRERSTAVNSNAKG